MVGAGTLTIFEFCLRDSGTERDVPECRRLRLVRLSASKIAKERTLGSGTRSAIDRLVGQAPINRRAEPLPQRFERLLIFDRESFAEFNEVPTRDRYLLLARFRRRRE